MSKEIYDLLVIELIKEMQQKSRVSAIRDDNPLLQTFLNKPAKEIVAEMNTMRAQAYEERRAHVMARLEERRNRKLRNSLRIVPP
jgi:hypothetical protein